MAEKKGATSAKKTKTPRNPSGVESIIAKDAVRAHNVDPFAFDVSTESGHTYGAFHPGAAGLDYAQLRHMSRIPIASAVVQVILSLISDCCTLQTTPYELGFRIRLEDKRKKMTRAAENEAYDIAKVVLAGGLHYTPGGMDTAVSMLMRDSLTLDQGNAEIIKDRAGRIIGYNPADAATLRLAKPNDVQRATGRWHPDADDEHVVIQRNHTGAVGEHWAAGEMMWGIRRARTDQNIMRYGYPEYDDLCGVLTWLVSSLTANAVTFTNGMHASTIIGFQSALDPTQWKALTRSMTAMLTGIRNAKRTVMVQLDPALKEDIKSVPLGLSNTEMEFTNWINFLTKLFCSPIGLDPALLGFVFGNEGQGGGLGQGNQEWRVKQSHQRCLKPILRRLAQWFTQWIVNPINSDFLMEFGGLDAPSDAERLEMAVKSISNYKTVDEVRAEYDLKPLGAPIGDMILNAHTTQVLMQQLGAEQGEGDDEGPQGGDDGPGGNAGAGLDDLFGLGPDDDDEVRPEDAKVGKVKSPGQLKEETGEALDKATRASSRLAERWLGDGRLVPRGPTRKGRRKLLVSTDEPGVKAWVVEVS